MKRFLTLLLAAILPGCAVLQPAPTDYRFETNGFKARVYQVDDGANYGVKHSAVGFLDVDTAAGQPVFRGIVIVTDCNQDKGQFFIVQRDETGRPFGPLRRETWDSTDPDDAEAARNAKKVCSMVDPEKSA